MLNLPTSTEINKQLPKNAIFTMLKFNKAQKDSFDNDISRVVIANEISVKTLNISKGSAVDSIFVLSVQLKNKIFNEKNIVSLSKMIERNIVYLLKYEDEYKLGIYHTKLITGEWQAIDNLSLPLKGLSLDTVWENIVTTIGDVEIVEGNTLEEQIVADEERVKLLNRIERLEKQARAERQPKKKFELVQEIKRLQNQIGG